MFSQLEEKVGNIGGKGFWAVPLKNGNSGTSVDDRIPKVNFRRGEVEDG